MAEIKSSRPLTELKKGDKVKVDGKVLEIDAHYIFEDYGTTKEMLIELFDPKAKEDDGDFQIRYFDDQVNESIKVYELKKIVYEEIEAKKIEW
jgi:cobyric acid synthase